VNGQAVYPLSGGLFLFGVAPLLLITCSRELRQNCAIGLAPVQPGLTAAYHVRYCTQCLVQPQEPLAPLWAAQLAEPTAATVNCVCTHLCAFRCVRMLLLVVLLMLRTHHVLQTTLKRYVSRAEGFGSRVRV